jgi:hypothetical protein
MICGCGSTVTARGWTQRLQLGMKTRKWTFAADFPVPNFRHSFRFADCRFRTSSCACGARPFSSLIGSGSEIGCVRPISNWPQRSYLTLAVERSDDSAIGDQPQADDSEVERDCGPAARERERHRYGIERDAAPAFQSEPIARATSDCLPLQAMMARSVSEYPTAASPSTIP